MKKILIVDDVKTNRILLKQTLFAMGDYSVSEAVDGKEALSKFEQETPDLILMDIDMPEMDGYQSATALKKLSGENYIPIIFVTALSAEASLARALASGGDDFIGKPFDADVLKSKIDVHLRVRKLNQQLNDRNFQLIRINQRLTREQELIEHFFESALLKSFLDEKIIKYHMSPMSTFNGDLLLVERGPKGGMYLLMGDFSGHGLTAAMGTLPVAMVFFKMANQSEAVGDIAYELNHQLNKLMPPDMFFAATLLELNVHGDIMTVWMGGMPENLWYGNNGELKATIHAKHMPLGILSDNEFDAETEIFNVEKGDKLYLYSDGVIESRGSDGEMFGLKRLKELLATQENSRFERVLKGLKDYTGKNSQNDDISLVEMTCCEIPAIKQDEENQDDGRLDLPWQISVSLSVDDMRKQDPVSGLSDMLGSLPALTRHKGVLHVLLSEMYLNALDHSILKMDSSKKVNDEQFVEYYEEREAKLQMLEDASIVFDLVFFPQPGQQCLKINIKDNGKGFSGYLSGDAGDAPYGRGLKIINSFCESVSFSDDGRALEVLFRL